MNFQDTLQEDQEDVTRETTPEEDFQRFLPAPSRRFPLLLVVVLSLVRIVVLIYCVVVVIITRNFKGRHCDFILKWKRDMENFAGHCLLFLILRIRSGERG